MPYLSLFEPFTASWQKMKCKEFNLTYATGVLYENEARGKNLEIRHLIPSREKRISPDSNCLLDLFLRNYRHRSPSQRNKGINY